MLGTSNRAQWHSADETSLACPSVRECRLKSDALRLTICEVDGEEPVRAIETLELHLATLGELDS